MRVEIVDIGIGDAFSNDKERMIGQEGTFAIIEAGADGFYYGSFYPDDRSVFTYGGVYVFRKLKTKPIFDA